MSVKSRAIMPPPDEMAKIEGWIEDIANMVGVPSPIIKGIVWEESKYDINSFRYNYNNVYDRSYGLMHLSIQTAQYIANIVAPNTYTITASSLYDPYMNLWLGCEYLKMLYNKYGDWNMAISAYNAGSPRYTSAGNFINQAYVNNVVKVSQILRNHVVPFATTGA
jgi:soluble lytic murein transglycosylase-like protein